jgi:predicted Zn-dependent protease
LNDYATLVDYANKLLDNGALTAEEDKEIRFGRAFAQYKQGNNDEASKNFAELAPNTNSIYGAQAAYYLAEVQFNTNQLSKAETTLNTFIDAGTEHEYWLARAFILLADVYHKQGNSFEATEYLESLKNNYPGKNDDIFELIESRLSKWNQSKSKN